MRLFMAFDVSEEAENELKRQQAALKKTDPGLGFTREFHLTLKFLGEVDEKLVGELKSRLSRIKFDAFTANLSDAGVFPSEDYIRAAWIGLEPKEKINALQQQIEGSLEGMFQKEERFHPHLTLARVKFIKDKKALIGGLKRMDVKKVNFRVDSFKLIKSTLAPGGPVYEVLEEFKAK
ncbi:RNA 2',3'-cyclic phosphodiesterase [Candidatus Woesearchaeota archaeon CG10_big_fil_rev_8_21_14_0_10_44_13]|nr:MAG: RNA 2',3'-cyclic phosphodiesterase [Candidatus Woesearchaeota archaeon CG10_big_fil_rev_8_21_14_0_10_44_13]